MWASVLRKMAPKSSSKAAYWAVNDSNTLVVNYIAFPKKGLPALRTF